MLHPNVCCRSRKIPITQSFERTTSFQLFVLHIVSLSSPCPIQCYDSLHATIFIKQSNVEISNILLEPLFPIMVLATASITGTGVASKLLGAVLSDLVVRCVSVALSFSPTTATPSLRFRCLLDGWHPQEASSSQGLGSFAVALIFYVFFLFGQFFFGRMACFRHSHDLAGNNLPIGVCPRAGQAGWEATAILSHIMSFCNIQRWIPSRSCKLRFVSCFLYLNTAFQKTCDEWSPIPHCIEELYSLQMTHRPSSFMKTSFDPKRLQMQARCTCDTKLVTLLNCAVSSLRMGQQHQILSPRLR